MNEKDKIMIISFGIILVFIILAYYFPPLHFLYRIQSENRIRNTEDLNLKTKKAITQWWYFDCFFEDGSVLVFLFTPYHWWREKGELPHSLFHFSYKDANGEVKNESKVFNYDEVHYNEKGLNTPFFELTKTHDKNTKTYTIIFFLPGIQGTAKIKSNIRAFSPFPWGVNIFFRRKHRLKEQIPGWNFRYASHIPQGNIDCQLNISGSQLHLRGKVYHEQGWFSGYPHQMGDGWIWFHFVSKSMNLFGVPEKFLCVEKDGIRLIGGPNILDKGCFLSDKVYSDKSKIFLSGGSLHFASTRITFDIKAKGVATELIYIPSINTGQCWGTVAQPSHIRFRYLGKELQEEGWLMLETCNMRKEERSHISVNQVTLANGLKI